MRNEDKLSNQKGMMKKESMAANREMVTAFLHSRPSGKIDSTTLFYGEVRLTTEAPITLEAGLRIDGIVDGANGLPDEVVVLDHYEHLEIPELGMFLGPVVVEAKDRGQKRVGTTVSVILK